MSANPFKAAIAARQRQIGLWISLANGYAAEVCAATGFDWALIDGEHAPSDLRTILLQLQGFAGHATHPVVRPPVGSPQLIKQLLDIGVQSLLIPMVDTAEQARALVAALRYPPRGIRGVGARMARASGFGLRGNYVHEADDGICLLVQIESPEGLRNLETIAAVEGVDGIFVGPSDLSASHGHLGNPAHPGMRALIDATLRRIAAAGKPSGIVSYDGTESQHFIDIGTTFVAVGGDAGILSGGARALAARFAGVRTAA
ncbi:MAG: aldolase/citrate lyase family protein [Pseudomonadota bacterium]